MADTLPTLKQHIALILTLLRASPNKDFINLYHLARLLVSNSSLHQVTDNDIKYFTLDDSYWLHDGLRSYYYDKVIHTSIGYKTMRWFVETQLIPLIELHIKISTNGNNLKPVTIESVENLL